TQRGRLIVAREELGLALGFAGPMGVAPHLSLDALIDETRRACRTVAGAWERSDVVASQQKALVAERKVTEAKMAYSPKINLTTNYTATSELFDNTLASQRFTVQTWVLSA